MKLAPLLILTLIVSSAVSAQVQPRIYYPSSNAIRAAGDSAVNLTQRHRITGLVMAAHPIRNALLN